MSEIRKHLPSLLYLYLSSLLRLELARNILFLTICYVLLSLFLFLLWLRSFILDANESSFILAMEGSTAKFVTIFDFGIGGYIS
mgnify:CR=1 FL=1